MTKHEARQTLRTTESSNQFDIEASFNQKNKELEAKINLAPNAEFAERYRSEQAKLKEARQILLSDAPETPPESSKAIAELSPEEKIRLDNGRERKMKLLEELGEPVDSAPSMVTVNGIGFNVFGSMHDPDLSPKFFVNYGFCFIFPLTPTAAFLVTLGKRGYSFHKKYSHDDLRKIYGNEKIQKFWVSKF